MGQQNLRRQVLSLPTGQATAETFPQLVYIPAVAIMLGKSSKFLYPAARHEPPPAQNPMYAVKEKIRLFRKTFVVSRDNVFIFERCHWLRDPETSQSVVQG